MSRIGDEPGPKRGPMTAPATSSAAIAVPVSNAPTPTLSGRLQDRFAAAVVMGSLRMTARIRSCGSSERTGAASSEEAASHAPRSEDRHELRAESAPRQGLGALVVRSAADDA